MADAGNPDPAIFELMTERSFHVPKGIYAPKRRTTAVEATFLLKHQWGCPAVWKIVQGLIEKYDSVVAMLAMAENAYFSQVLQHGKENPSEFLRENDPNKQDIPFDEHKPIAVTIWAYAAAAREIDKCHSDRKSAEEFELMDSVPGWHSSILDGTDQYRITCKKLAACCRLLMRAGNELSRTDNITKQMKLAKAMFLVRLADFRKSNA